MNFIKKVFVVFSTLIFIQTISGDEKVKLKENFLKKIDSVVLIVEDKKLTKKERDAKIVDTLSSIFDFDLMAKLTLGKKWRVLTPKDRKRFVELYVKKMKRSYSSKIDAYKGEKVVVTKIVQPKPNRIALVTNLTGKKSSLEIIYKFYKPKKQKKGKSNWLIYDLVTLGVSVIKTDKLQFKEYLQTHTISELIANLEQKLTNNL